MSLRPGQGCDVCMDSVCVEGREAEKWRCSRPVWSLLLQNKTSKHVPLTQCLDVDEKQNHASGSRDENVHQMCAFLGLCVSAWLKYIQIYVCWFFFVFVLLNLLEEICLVFFKGRLKLLRPECSYCCCHVTDRRHLCVTSHTSLYAKMILNTGSDALTAPKPKNISQMHICFLFFF